MSVFFRFHRARLILAASAALYLGSLHGFAASMDQWNNSASGLWSTGSNWSSNRPPDSTFTLIMITNASSKTVTVDAATPATNLAIQRLTISAPVGSANTLALSDVGTNQPLQLSLGLTVDAGGVLSMTNSALNSAGVTVNRGGTLNVTNSIILESGVLSTFDIVNGNAWLDSGLIDCSAIQFVRLGRTNNGVGVLNLNGGMLLAPELQVATSTSARGTLNVSGGTVNASGFFTVGYGVNSTGTVSVTAGQVIATNNITYVGKSGFGQMSVSGGSTTLAFVSVGNNANGLLSVSGGQLTMNPRTTNDWFQIGNVGAGQFNLTGGTVYLGGECHIGDDSTGLGTGSGTATITGGQLIATNDLFAIGRYGPGQMTVSNATTWLTNVSVGRHDGATGILNVQSNAQMYLLDALSIARFSNSVGHVLVTGGLLSLTNDIVWIGREGSGDLTISNGTVRALSGVVALSTVVTDSITLLPVTNVPSGTLTLAGGSLVLTSNLLVGTDSISTGQVSVAGGTLNIGGNENAAYLAVGGGTFTLSQGSVVTGNLFLTNNGGQFLFNGGLLQAGNITVSNGAPFIVGDGVNPATLQLQGGTFFFANGLVISSNATVMGCGTILGNISNLGTLTTNCGPTGVVITSATRTGSTVTVFFTTLSGSNHVLEYKNALNDASWTAILPGVIGNGGVASATDNSATVPRRFYRIHLQ
jgi:fibronectin-binding autotransporter adhesin